MKIGPSPENKVSSNLSVQTNSTKSSQSAAATALSSAKSAGVAVTVSTQAQSLGKAVAQEGADVDSAKVESVRSAIEQGTYSVNPEAIAEKLLGNAQELLNRTKN